MTKRKWGKNYTPIENVARGLPNDKTGDCLEIADQLLKDRILLSHKKGKCVSLNVKLKKIIMEFLENFDE